MSGQLAAEEPYATRFETEVTSIDGNRVWLERSYFYAESGGQPADRGTIDGIDVDDVQLVDGDPVHVLTEEPSFRVGGRVLCSVDWSFRMYCMRAHTASHVLYGAGRRLLDDLGYGGFDISEEKVRVDLETSTTIDDEMLLELNERMNQAVWESRSVSWEDVPVAQARERDDVAFNEATEDGALRKGRVRLVTIGGKDDGDDGSAIGFGGNGASGARVVTSDGNGNVVEADVGTDASWDVAACGGTHVRNTREIGPVTILGRANPGDGLTRIEFAVGPAAIDRRTAEKRAVFDAKRTLGSKIEDVPAELAHVVDGREQLANRLQERERALADERLTGHRVSRVDDEGRNWHVATVGELPTDVVSDAVRERVVTDADEDGTDATESSTPAVVVAIGESDSTFVVVGTDGSRSAATILEELTGAFGGGGGGSPQLAQGGGFDATPEEIRRSLE